MTAKNIISMAASQIGIKEQPANSNKVKYNTEYYGHEVSGSAYPWCCVFVWWVFRECGASDLFYGGKKTAYCPTVEAYYKKLGKWYQDGQTGDLVLFDFSKNRKNNRAGHIGIVEKVNPDGSYTTIEGNTGSGNYANGGAVMRRIRYKSTIRGFARPDYSGDFKFTETLVDYIGTITASELNVRRQPTTNSQILAKHKKNDIVNISAKTDNGWYRVDYPNIGTGYICADYVSVKKAERLEAMSDSVPDEWAKASVSMALKNGILFGDSSGDLKLHKDCTRQEAIVLLYRLYNNLRK